MNEIGVTHSVATAPTLGTLAENGKSGLQGRRGWPARGGMASIHPLPGPDAKTPAFPKIFFLTNAVVFPRSQGRTPHAWERREMDEPHNEPDVFLFESALAELLTEGVAEDVRPTLQNFINTRGQILQAYQLLPPQEQLQLDRCLPAFDVSRSDRLRNPSLSEALRKFMASMDEAPTQSALHVGALGSDGPLRTN